MLARSAACGRGKVRGSSMPEPRRPDLQSTPDSSRGGKGFAAGASRAASPSDDLMSHDDETGPAPFSRNGKRCPAATPERDKPRSALSICDPFARAIHTKEAVVTYLIVGLDLKTHASWHEC